MMRFAAIGLVSALALVQPAPQAGGALPPWTPGTLDIHQIVTARGNAAFFQFPDGTTMLLDAGDSGPSDELNGRPDTSRPSAETIVQYVRQMSGSSAKLDYALLTHFHPDHIGGFLAVAKELAIDTIVDRGYAYLPPAANDSLFAGYRAFVDGKKNSVHITARAGSTTQIVPRRNPAQALGIEARIVSVNDRVWTGTGDASKNRFPVLSSIANADDRPTENMCSVTLRIKYGRFDYFTGGDQPGYPVPGAPAWHDVESDVARAIGPTDVHVVNHHGSIEEENPFWLKTLASRVMIVPAWSPTHPSPDVLKRLLATRIYPKPRDIFITLFRPPTKATTGPRATQVASDHGHVVVRVEPGGERYWVYVLDETVAGSPIRLIKGPYQSE